MDCWYGRLTGPPNGDRPIAQRLVLTHATFSLTGRLAKIPWTTPIQNSGHPSVSAKINGALGAVPRPRRRNSVDVSCDKNSASLYGPSRSASGRLRRQSRTFYAADFNARA